jgi:secreted trypsin-like serine protease
MNKYTYSSIMALLLLALSACAPAGSDQLTDSQNDSAIIGGTTVIPGSQLSKQVFMIYSVSRQGGGICTATMITPTVGLTAAHCVDNMVRGYAIFAIDAIGVLDKAKSREDLLKNQNVIEITAARVHPWWNGSINNKNNGDIAVFRLAKAKPADFQVTRIHSGTLRKGTRLIASGYGIISGSLGFGSGLLRETRVSVLDPNVSESEFGVDQRRAQGVCSGDSGGPAFVVSPFGRLEQVGIVSYGDEGCEQDGVYTYANFHMDFINKAIVSLR